MNQNTMQSVLFPSLFSEPGLATFDQPGSSADGCAILPASEEQFSPQWMIKREQSCHKTITCLLNDLPFGENEVFRTLIVEQGRALGRVIMNIDKYCDIFRFNAHPSNLGAIYKAFGEEVYLQVSRHVLIGIAASWLEIFIGEDERIKPTN